MENRDNIQLNKYLAGLGVTSRRKAVELITSGRVRVNGQITIQPGTRINPALDKIIVDGKKVDHKEQFIYLALNKPKGVVSTVADERSRKTVIDLVKGKFTQRLYPVGRLDQDSSGLIILTNDGELTNRLTHPKFHISKIYQCLVSSPVSEEQLQKLRVGVQLKDGKTAPAQVQLISQNARITVLEIVLHEGKNRQLRRMCGQVGINLLELKRVAIGPVRLQDLPLGKYRCLTPKEVVLLKAN